MESTDSCHGWQDEIEVSNVTGKEKLCRSEKKRRLRAENIRLKKVLRKEKKEMRKLRMRQEYDEGDRPCETTDRPSKREVKMERDRRCRSAMADGQRVCIDLSIEKHMSSKELSKVAQQLGRLYGANRQSVSPFHVYFAGINKNGEMYSECVRKNDGFENYLVEMHECPLTDLFNAQDIVYLSPDAEETLTVLDKSKVYVIAGFVDESIKRNVTSSKCEDSGICCKRLPIVEFMERQPGLVRYSTVLTINQVFETLLRFHETSDWSLALSQCVPKRSGYTLKTDTSGVSDLRPNSRPTSISTSCEQVL